MERLKRADWHVFAGVGAAVIALLLHFLHIVETDVLVGLTLVLVALMLLVNVRREEQGERLLAIAERTESLARGLEAGLHVPDAVLVGPKDLRTASERFSQSAAGDTVWFNVCTLMFQSQALFDRMLRPAIENPSVTSIQFISDHSERELWMSAVQPKVAECQGADKVSEPYWRDLDESVSFIMADVRDRGGTEALLSFWGEPFMARSTRGVPRYMFRVQRHSELIGHLRELERNYRLNG
ncbi:MAG: hypothetical protein ACOC5K_02290 [Chloroflexota bacterium]